MKQTYLVVFEKVAEDNWGGFAPDVQGAVGAGGSLDAARQSVLEGIGYHLEDLAERGLPVPEAKTGTVDFAEFDPDHLDLQYVVEWLAVELPEMTSLTHGNAQQAA